MIKCYWFQLWRPSTEQLMRRCRYLLRKHRFQELAGEDPIAALSYLQTSLAQMVDHTDSEETREVRVRRIDCYTVIAWWQSDSQWGMRYGVQFVDIKNNMSLVALNIGWDCLSHNGLWAYVISVNFFQRPLAVLLHSPNGRPAVRAMQRGMWKILGWLRKQGHFTHWILNKWRPFWNFKMQFLQRKLLNIK